jgi:hypothetical protein
VSPEFAFLAEHKKELVVKSWLLTSPHTVGMENPLDLVGNVKVWANRVDRYSEIKKLCAVRIWKIKMMYF